MGTHASSRADAGGFRFGEESMRVKDGDIIVATFRFSETEGRKIRPALVFDTNAVSATLVCVSSVKLVKAFDTEVVLTTEESLSLGLAKQSKLDFMKRDRIALHEVRKVLGHISSLPSARIAECFAAARAAGLVSD
jgi:mRNA-degrading endonuclease toxin of MazEF toxin-antitoxin module